MKYKYYRGKNRKMLQATLRNHGFRSTEGRLGLLAVLKSTRTPLSVSDITKKLGNNLDEVNVYRALEALTGKGVLARSDFRQGGARYEYANSHHHHLVCSDCGFMEDVEVCVGKHMEHTVLCSSRAFAKVSTHALEFFGLCNVCVKDNSYA